MVGVIAGVGVATFAAATHKELSGAPVNSESVTATVTMTRTLPNGSTIISTSVTVGNGVGCTGETCLYVPYPALVAVAVTRAYANATAKVVTFQVKNVGSVNATLAGANVTVYSVNSWYEGSVVVSLQGNQLGRGSTTDITTPAIPYLVPGDHVAIKVWTTVGTFAEDTVTAGP